MLMYPEANIPCLQISLQNSLDTLSHINIGKALQKMMSPNLLILGSGFSFHHMHYFFDKDKLANFKNNQFQDWLIASCTQEKSKAESDLLSWMDAPHAQFCHPRAEHLMPLFVCHGASQSPGQIIFDDEVCSKRTIGIAWD